MIIRTMIFFKIFFVVVSALATDFDTVIGKSGIAKQNLGLWIQGPDKNFQLNAEKPFIPASVSKIVTAGAVIGELGLDYHFETKIYKDGNIKDGVLKGDLYLQGGGDPALVSESYWSMVNELKRTGIKSIDGQLYVDDFLYEQNRYSDGRQDTRVDRAYDAPIGALSFNWNSVNVFVRPGETSPKLFADPENEYIQVINKAKMGSKTSLSIERKSQAGKDIISVFGSIATGESEQVVYKSITQPDYWAGYNFKAFMAQQGITYSGDVQKKKVPPQADLLVTFKSKPLKDLVADMNKFSNNYVAEMLTIAMADDRPATLNRGLEKTHKWLNKMGWIDKNFVFTNPAGFTNQNQIRPMDLGSLLVKLQKEFSSAPEFMSSLPIAGVDGTLKKRLQDMKLRVRAKTGLLNGKIALAGYAEKDNKVYTFAFMFNGPSSQEVQARNLFDNLLRKL